MSATPTTAATPAPRASDPSTGSAVDDLPEHVPVLVVGGGPVGLVASVLLGRHGIGEVPAGTESDLFVFIRVHSCFHCFITTGTAGDVAGRFGNTNEHE